jgi:hypothetical protein
MIYNRHTDLFDPLAYAQAHRKALLALNYTAKPTYCLEYLYFGLVNVISDTPSRFFRMPGAKEKLKVGVAIGAWVVLVVFVIFTKISYAGAARVP